MEPVSLSFRESGSTEQAKSACTASPRPDLTHSAVAEQRVTYVQDCGDFWVVHWINHITLCTGEVKEAKHRLTKMYCVSNLFRPHGTPALTSSAWCLSLLSLPRDYRDILTWTDAIVGCKHCLPERLKKPAEIKQSYFRLDETSCV